MVDIQFDEEEKKKKEATSGRINQTKKKHKQNQKWLFALYPPDQNFTIRIKMKA